MTLAAGSHDVVSDGCHLTDGVRFDQLGLGTRGAPHESDHAVARIIREGIRFSFTCKLAVAFNRERGLAMARRGSPVSVALLLLTATALAHGASVTVTTVEDTVDFTGARTIEDLPGPDGLVSLSEAFIATNNTAGHDRIEFAIPLGPGQTMATFTSITGFYWRAFDSVTIDGTSQTEFGGDTNPDGREVRVLQWPLYALADDSGVLGFHNSEIFVVGGANSLIESNTGSTGTANYEVGSGCTVRNNTGSTIKITGSDNVVVGNTFDRIRMWGGTNNRIGGADTSDRNIVRGYGYVNSEGLPAGAAVELFNTTDVLVENNWIGTLDGLTQGNIACTMGIDFSGTNSGAVIRDNLISGILGRGQPPHHAGQLFGWGIYMEGTADDISIVGNTLGLDITSEPTLGAVTGISLGTWATISLTDIRIGGQGAGDGNVIAGQVWDGIVVDDEVQEVRISGRQRDLGEWAARNRSSSSRSVPERSPRRG
jgi:hypothetical protein